MVASELERGALTPESIGARLREGGLLRHEGYEVGTVTAGGLAVDFDTDVVTLAADDSITLKAGLSRTVPCSAPWSGETGDLGAVALPPAAGIQRHQQADHAGAAAIRRRPMSAIRAASDSRTRR